MTKTAIVTGSSGGIGSALSATLVDANYRVIGLDVQAPDSPDWEHRTCDLSDAEQVQAMVRDLKHTVSVVVHCAAHQPLVKVGEGTWTDWERTFRVNVLALEEIVSLVLPGLRQDRSGVVLAISSIHGTTTSGGLAPYSCTKAALDAWVRAAAIDLSPDVTAISVALGAVDSPKLTQGLQRWSDPTAARLNLLSRIPAGDLMTAVEVAEVALTLLRPGARHLTGSKISMDGGVSARLASE